jgi:hypothetical protein
LEVVLEQQDSTALGMINAPLGRLADYYGHLYELAQGYLKDPLQREEQLGIVRSWQEDVEQLHSLLK